MRAPFISLSLTPVPGTQRSSALRIIALLSDYFVTSILPFIVGCGPQM